MADRIGCSESTVKRNLKYYNIRLRDKYSKLSDAQLKSYVKKMLDPSLEIGNAI